MTPLLPDRMGGENDRLVAACDDCGSVYAAIELSNGDAQPIGKRNGCSCGGTDFTPVTELDASGAPDVADDDDD